MRGAGPLLRSAGTLAVDGDQRARSRRRRARRRVVADRARSSASCRSGLRAYVFSDRVQTRVVRRDARRLERRARRRLALAARARHVRMRATRAAVGSARWRSRSALRGRARSAQEGPYSNYLVGERSLGLAGAFVGLADDPSAIFHNPGGTARLPTTAAAGSLWALVRGSREVANGYRTDLGAHRPRILRAAVAAVVPGRRVQVRTGADRRRAPARARRSRCSRRTATSGASSRSSTRDDAVDRLEVRHNDRARWLGVSYGYRLRPGAVARRERVLGDALARPRRSRAARAREQLPTDSMVGLGAQPLVDAQHRHRSRRVARWACCSSWRRELRAGVMFQPPGLQFADSVEAEHLVTHVGPDPTQIRAREHRSAAAPTCRCRGSCAWA